MWQTICEKVRGLCSLALEGKISIDELYSSWPKEANENPLFRLIFEDLEDGIEHIPGYFLKPDIDMDAWKNSREFLMIFLDNAILQSNLSVDEMFHCRERILSRKGLDQDFINNSINSFS